MSIMINMSVCLSTHLAVTLSFEHCSNSKMDGQNSIQYEVTQIYPSNIRFLNWRA
jgi:hypothetical protein